MRATVLGLVGVLMVVGGAQAGGAVYEANGRDVSASLKVQADASGKSTARYDLVSHGCIGEISGDLVKLSDAEMLLSADDASGGQCKVRITQSGKSVTLREDDSGNCSYFRGASCVFGQVLSLRK